MQVPGVVARWQLPERSDRGPRIHPRVCSGRGSVGIDRQRGGKTRRNCRSGRLSTCRTVPRGTPKSLHGGLPGKGGGLASARLTPKPSFAGRKRPLAERFSRFLTSLGIREPFDSCPRCCVGVLSAAGDTARRASVRQAHRPSERHARPDGFSAAPIRPRSHPVDRFTLRRTANGGAERERPVSARKRYGFFPLIRLQPGLGHFCGDSGRYRMTAFRTGRLPPVASGQWNRAAVLNRQAGYQRTSEHLRSCAQGRPTEPGVFCESADQPFSSCWASIR